MTTFGNTGTAGTVSNQWGNNKVGSRFTLTENALVSSITAELRDYAEVGQTDAVRYGVYDASENLKGSTNQGNTPAARAAVQLNFATSLSLPAGEYHLKAIFNARTEFWRDTGSTSQYESNADTYSDGFADPMGEPAETQDWSMEIYATYTPSGGLSQTITDTVTISDGTPKIEVLLIIEEFLDFVDSHVKNPSKSVVEYINVYAQEFASLLGALSATVTDILNVSDAGIRKEIHIIIIDVATVASSTSAQILEVLSQIITDIITFMDSMLKNPSKHVSDNINFVDSQVKNALKQIVDALSMASSTVQQLLGALSQTITDIITISDAKTSKLLKLVSDALNVADSLSAQLLGNVLSQIVEDALNVASEIKAAFTKNFTDNLTLSAEARTKLSKVYADAITLATSTTAWLPEAFAGIYVTLTLKKRNLELVLKKIKIALRLVKA